MLWVIKLAAWLAGVGFLMSLPHNVRGSKSSSVSNAWQKATLLAVHDTAKRSGHAPMLGYTICGADIPKRGCWCGAATSMAATFEAAIASTPVALSSKSTVESQCASVCRVIRKCCVGANCRVAVQGATVLIVGGMVFTATAIPVNTRSSHHGV